MSTDSMPRSQKNPLSAPQSPNVDGGVSDAGPSDALARSRVRDLLAETRRELSSLRDVLRVGSVGDGVSRIPERLLRIQELMASIDGLVLPPEAGPGPVEYPDWVAGDMKRLVGELGTVMETVKSSADLQDAGGSWGSEGGGGASDQLELKLEDLDEVEDGAGESLIMSARERPKSALVQVASDKSSARPPLSMSARRVGRKDAPNRADKKRPGSVSTRRQMSASVASAWESDDDLETVGGATSKRRFKAAPAPSNETKFQVFCGKLLPVQAVYRGRRTGKEKKSRRGIGHGAGLGGSRRTLKRPSSARARGNSAAAGNRDKSSSISTLETARSRMSTFTASDAARKAINACQKDARKYKAGHVPRSTALRYAAMYWAAARDVDPLIKARYRRHPSASVLEDIFLRHESPPESGTLQSVRLPAFLADVASELVTSEFEDSDVDDCNFLPLERKLNAANLRNSEDVLMERARAGGFGITPLTRSDFVKDPRYAPSQIPEGESSRNDALLPGPGGMVKSLASEGRWLRDTPEPLNAPPNDPRAPNRELRLEWVYGYRCRDAHSNIVVDGQGCIVYPVSNVAVVLDAKASVQRHYRGHTGGITCLAQSPTDRNIVVTGAAAGLRDRTALRPEFRVWDTKSLETVWACPSAHMRAVRCAGFSPDGTHLATCGFGDGDAMVVRLWDWKAQESVAEVWMGRDLILDLQWAVSDPARFITAGRNRLLEWTVSEGGGLASRPATVEGAKVGAAGVEIKGGSSAEARRTFTCAVHLSNGDVVVGTQGLGEVIMLRDGAEVGRVSEHTGSVYCLATCGSAILSGGKDGRVNVYHGTDLKLVQQFEFGAAVRALVAEDDGALYVGTVRARVWQIPGWQSAADTSGSRALATGHFDGELQALDSHPRDPSVFVTAGEDNRISVWDAARRRPLSSWAITTRRSKRVKRRGAAATSSQASFRCARAVCYSSDGSLIAVGTASGDLRVFDAASQEETRHLDLNRHTRGAASRAARRAGPGGAAVTLLRFSPNDKVLAVGCAGALVLLDVVSGHIPKFHAPVAGGVVSVDWTRDSKHVRIMSGACELIYFDVFCSNLKLSRTSDDPRSVARTDDFATRSAPLTWGTQGARDPETDGTDPTRVAVSSDGKLLVTGDSFGVLRVARYPQLRHTNHVASSHAHAAAIAALCVTCDGSRVVTVGGRDKCVAQWELVPTQGDESSTNADTDAGDAPYDEDGFVAAVGGPSGTRRQAWAGSRARERALRGRLSELRREIEALKKRGRPRYELKEEVFKLHRKISDLKESAKRQREKAALDMRAVVEQHAQSEARLRGRLKVLRKRRGGPAAVAAAEAQRYKDQARSLREANRALETELEQARVNGAATAVDGLRHTVDTQRHKIKGYASKLLKLTQMIKKYKRGMDGYERCRANVAQLEQENSVLRKKNQRLLHSSEAIGENERLTQESLKLRAEVKDITTRLDAVREKLRSTAANEKRASSGLKALRVAHGREQAEVKRLVEVEKSLRSQMAKNKKQAADAESIEVRKLKVLLLKQLAKAKEWKTTLDRVSRERDQLRKVNEQALAASVKTKSPDAKAKDAKSDQTNDTKSAANTKSAPDVRKGETKRLLARIAELERANGDLALEVKVAKTGETAAQSRAKKLQIRIKKLESASSTGGGDGPESADAVGDDNDSLELDDSEDEGGDDKKDNDATSPDDGKSAGQLRVELASVRKQLKEAEDTLFADASGVEQFETALQGMKKRIETLNEAELSHIKEKEELQDKFEEEQSQRKEAEEENARLRKQYDDLAKETRGAATDGMRAAADLEEVRGALKASRSRVTDLEKENKKLASQLDDMMKENLELEEEEDMKEQEIEELKSKHVKKLKDEIMGLKTRHASALLAATSTQAVLKREVESLKTKLHLSLSAKVGRSSATEPKANSAALSASPVAKPAAEIPTLPAAAELCENCEEQPATVSCRECGEDYCVECDAELHEPVKLSSHSRTKIGVVPMCENCEDVPAVVRCVQCAEVYCADCNYELHLIKKMKGHKRTPLPAVLRGLSAVAETALAPAPFKEQSTPVAKEEPAPLPKEQPVGAKVCENCEEEKAAVQCVECGENYCAECDEEIHIPKKFRGHERLALLSNGERACANCEEAAVAIDCRNCKKQYCTECDEELHSVPKFSRHERFVL